MEACAELVKVAVPGGYANRVLNGSLALPLRRGPVAMEVVLLTGPEAGRWWQVARAHLVPATPAASARGFSE